MIDVHHHLLWGVDDGPANQEVSMAMAERCIGDGVEHIVCSPHHNDVYRYNPEIVNERFAWLQDQLAGRLELSLASEMHLSAENIVEAEANFPRYSINNKGYLIVEFPSYSITPAYRDALFRLQAAGYSLIVTHPERYAAVLNHPALISEWLDAGCLIQVTASAFFGRFGKAAEVLANELLDRNWIHFIATDAHNMSGRSPRMKRTYDYIANRCGEETARRLCCTNPRAAVDGASWPEQPEPIGLLEGRPLHFDIKKIKPEKMNAAKKDSTAPRPPGLLGRLFGRR